MSKKVLITGCKGQLGRDLQSCAKFYTNVQALCTDIDSLDLTQLSAVQNYINEHQPDVIVNCAAYTAVDKAEDEEEQAILLNATAVKHLTIAARQVNALLIQISTDYVFDGKKQTPYLESDSVNPQSAYGRSKLMGEEAALAYEHAMVIRTSWLYAAEGNNFVNTMLRLGAERNELNVVDDQRGTPTYAADLAEAILTIISKIDHGEKPFMPGIYHYSNEGVCSWFNFAQRIMALGQRSCVVRPINSSEYPTKAVRPPYSVLSKEKIKTMYELRIPAWPDALARCFLKIKT
ncbi:MAG: dTDP-4-dehydrorhamnose reductase [Bacteroidales bacterium]|nr:dTDP-4-dehydrorhamnose reductase [Bacteroidales bacterium]MCL2132919.1 dTDP-4-dehydrorhamnose reductase [Bacteroidales bacterium]